MAPASSPDSAPADPLATLRAAWGPPPEPREAQRDRPGISLATLADAPFGDQLLLYGIARMIAERQKLAFETPDWIGRDLFRVDDPLLADPPRPPIVYPEETALASLFAPAIAEVSKKRIIDGDLAGHFHGSTARWAQRRNDFRALFEFEGAAMEFCDLAWNRLANQGYFVVAIDPPSDPASPAFAWYEAWLDSIWPNLPSAALYITGGNDAVREALARFDPVLADDVADPLPGSTALVDFAMITHADVLGIGAGSFSFVASLLNRDIKVSVRPDPAAGALVPFDPWNAPVVLDNV